MSFLVTGYNCISTSRHFWVCFRSLLVWFVSSRASKLRLFKGNSFRIQLLTTKAKESSPKLKGWLPTGKYQKQGKQITALTCSGHVVFFGLIIFRHSWNMISYKIDANIDSSQSPPKILFKVGLARIYACCLFQKTSRSKYVRRL